MATNFKVKLFADDTFLSLDSNNQNELNKKVNEEIKKVSRWLADNKLTLNVTKTKYMIFSNRKSPNTDFQIKIDNHCLERCTSYKYLGVLLDDKLNWKAHVDYIPGKITKVCGFFA